jgi:translocation protein SEC63
LFNPYDILGLEMGASTREVKNAYRKLSKLYHPDVHGGDNTTETIFFKIVQAYKALTDEKARENWEKYGHPDGPQAAVSFYAVPQWLVEQENRYIVLGVYFLLFMVLLPFIAASKWWEAGKYISSHKVLRHSVVAFYTYARENMPISELIETLSASLEFASMISLKALEQKSIELIEKSFPQPPDSLKINAAYCRTVRVLLYAYFYRIDLDNIKGLVNPEKLKELQMKIVAKSSDLILHGMLPTLGFGKCYVESTLNCIKLHQMLLQGVHETASPLLMLPHIRKEMLDDRAPPTIAAFVFMSPAEKKSWLNNKNNPLLTSTQFEETCTLSEGMPALLINLKLGLYDNDKVYAESTVSLIVELQRVTTKEHAEIQSRKSSLSPEGK